MTSHLYKKIPYNVGNFAKLVVARGFKKLLKCIKSPNLVTLLASRQQLQH